MDHQFLRLLSCCRWGLVCRCGWLTLSHISRTGFKGKVEEGAA
jgi:hypothetical protein